MSSFGHIRSMAAGILLVFAAVALGVPPKVVRTVPENGADDVNPKLREIRIVFDQDMDQDGFSICGGGPKYPKTVGRARWVNKRTIVMRVKLAANHDYELSVNCPRYKNFKNVRGEAVRPYPVKFRTGALKEGQAERPSAVENKESMEELRRAIDENYSYWDLRKVNWDELFRRYGPKMEQAKDARGFAEAAAELLAHAEDAHIWVKIDDETVGGFRREIKRNYNAEVLKNVVPGWQQLSSVVYTGRYTDGIGYILIASWSGEHAEALAQAYAAIWDFTEAPGLIIDVRCNGGGAEPLAREFAGCFVDEPKVYAQHVYRSADAPGGFGQVNNRVLEPNKHRPRYRGKVVVLMGPANMSSCEAFLLMMKQVGGCKLVGETSYGGSGNPKPVNLGNGVSVFLPSWKAMRPDGTCFEGEGIRPDVIVEASEVELISRDPVLEAALKLLRQR